VSWDQMELLLGTKDLWESPAQFSVMTILCWRDHQKRGFAAPSARDIARVVGLSPQRVRKVFAQLEAMHAMTRLGTDREFSGRNRFALSIEKAIHEKSARGVIAGDQGGVIARDQGGDRPRSGGWSPAITPSPLNNKTVRQVQNATEATAAPRLPLFPLHVKPPHPEHVALKAAHAHRLQKLRSRVAGLARSILFNPSIGRELLNGEIATSIDSLVEATKRLCARKRVQGYGEVVHAMCTSELFKFRNPAVVSGAAPRPRDRARQARQGGRM